MPPTSTSGALAVFWTVMAETYWVALEVPLIGTVMVAVEDAFAVPLAVIVLVVVVLITPVHVKVRVSPAWIRDTVLVQLEVTGSLIVTL